MRKKTRLKPRRIALYVVFFVVFLIYIIPIAWIINNSFRLDVDTRAYPPQFFGEITTIHYENSFSTNNVSLNLTNSIIISVFSSVIALIIGVPCSYALSRFRFRGNQAIYFSFLGIRVAPIVLSVLPVFIWSRSLGIFDSLPLLIAMNTMNNVIWVVWMMRIFFDDLPGEIDEAAMVDGCNRLTCLLWVVGPLAAPGLSATLIFCVITTWNEYFMPLVLSSVRAVTLPMVMNSFISIYGLKWGEMCAAATIIMAPVLLFVLFLQKHLIKGLSAGAVKG